MSVDASYFTDLGIPPSQATALAAEHNRMAGQPADSPTPAVELPVIPVRTTSAIEARVTQLREFDPTLSVDEARAAANAEAAYAASSPQQRVALHAAEHEAAQDRVALASLDAVEPAPSPHAYVMPSAGTDPESMAIDNGIRDDLFRANVPTDMGSRAAELIDATGREVMHFTSEQLDAWTDSNVRALQSVWGAGYDKRLSQVREYVRTVFPPETTVGRLLKSTPELFGGWQTVLQIERLMNYSARRGGSRG